MLYNTDFSLAFKNKTGQYNTKRFSLFDIDEVSRKLPSFEVKTYKKREYSFKVKCPICGDYHYYNFSAVDMIMREMIIGGCNATGSPIFFIGSNNKIAEHINRVKNINKNLYAMI